MTGRQSKFLIWINYRVRVTIQDSRMLIGTFLAFDKHMNLVLADTEEYTRIKAKKPGEVDREKKRSLGLVLLRGENIVSISAESPPSQNVHIYLFRPKKLMMYLIWEVSVRVCPVVEVSLLPIFREHLADCLGQEGVWEYPT